MDRTKGFSERDLPTTDPRLSAESGVTPPMLGFGLKATLVQKMFDEVSFGVLLMDSAGELLFSNSAARELTGGDTGPGFFREMLNQCSVDELRAWQKAIHDCLQGKQPMLQVSACPKRVFIFTPLADDTRDRVGMIMLTVSRATLCEPDALTEFGRLYRLTRTEAAVLQSLVVGQSAEQIAAARGVAEATVRTHIKNTLHKTGYRSLRQLQAQLAKLPPVRRPVVREAGGRPR